MNCLGKIDQTLASDGGTMASLPSWFHRSVIVPPAFPPALTPSLTSPKARRAIFSSDPIVSYPSPKNAPSRALQRFL
ncbi:MAG: hypothetical protein WHV66_00110 [Anaerolineales bacterium]